MILTLPSPKYFCIFHILSPNCSFAKMTPGRHNTHKASLSSFSLISSYALCNDHTIFTRVQVCTCYICSASICSVDMHSFIKHRKDKDGRTRSHQAPQPSRPGSTEHFFFISVSSWMYRYLQLQLELGKLQLLYLYTVTTAEAVYSLVFLSSLYFHNKALQAR